MKYTKMINGTVVVKDRNQILLIRDGRQYINPTERLLLEDGWEPYAEHPQEETEEDRFGELAQLARTGLADSDYKVIKCMEAFLCGEPLPYDIAELHKERDAQRGIVNDYEEGL